MTARPRRRQPPEMTDDLVRRFWANADRRDPEECWVWRAARNRGYGVFSPVHGWTVNAHRVAYELTYGPIPSDPSEQYGTLAVDHLCSNPPCVNPAHLEAVTAGENTRRSNAIRIYGQQSHCKRGHALDGNNIYVDPRRGERACRQCRIDRGRAARRGMKL